MGSGKILSHLGKGKYRIEVEFDNSLIDAKLAHIDAELNKLHDELSEINTEAAVKAAQLAAANEALNEYLTNTPAEEYTANPGQLQQLTAAGYKAMGELDAIRQRQKRVQLRDKTLRTDRDYLNTYCPAKIETDAWCVAKNEKLTGTVKTIEPDYVISQQAGHITPGVWIDAKLDGQSPAPDARLQHPLANGVHGVFFNLAILPALQRDKMRYRVATLSNLDKNASTCTVTFEGAASINQNSSQLLPEPIYPDLQATASAKIEYPPCNGKAFQDGDRVIVMRKAGQMVVVGFAENPRDCAGTSPSVYRINWVNKFYVELAPTNTITTTFWSLGTLQMSPASNPPHYIEINEKNPDIRNKWDYYNNFSESRRLFLSNAFFDEALTINVNDRLFYSLASIPEYYWKIGESTQLNTYWVIDNGKIKFWEGDSFTAEYAVEPGGLAFPNFGYPPHYNQKFDGTITMRYQTIYNGTKIDETMIYDFIGISYNNKSAVFAPRQSTTIVEIQ